MSGSILPQSFFRLVPALYPCVLRILAAQELNGPQFFVLSYVKNFGRPTSQGQGVLLGDLHEQLIQAVGYKNSAGPSKFVDELIGRNLLAKNIVRDSERALTFPEAAKERWRNYIVVITDQGREKLAAVNSEAEGLARHIAGDGGFSARFISAAFRQLDQRFAKVLLRLDTWQPQHRPKPATPAATTKDQDH